MSNFEERPERVPVTALVGLVRVVPEERPQRITFRLVVVAPLSVQRPDVQPLFVRVRSAPEERKEHLVHALRAAALPPQRKNVRARLIRRRAPSDQRPENVPVGDVPLVRVLVLDIEQGPQAEARFAAVMFPTADGKKNVRTLDSAFFVGPNRCDRPQDIGANAFLQNVALKDRPRVHAESDFGGRLVLRRLVVGRDGRTTGRQGKYEEQRDCGDGSDHAVLRAS